MIDRLQITYSMTAQPDLPGTDQAVERWLRLNLALRFGLVPMAPLPVDLQALIAKRFGEPV